MIICLHFNGFGGLLKNTTGANLIIFKIIESLSIISVNLFVMITSYYMVNKKITAKKLLNLYLEIIFYNVLIYIIFLAVGIEKADWTDLFNLVPLTASKYWFATAYFIFYLSIPFLNILLKNLTKKQHAYLCLAIIVLTLINLLPLDSSKRVFNYNSGYSAIWFICVFIVIYFIKEYNLFDNLKARYIWLIFGFSTIIIYFTNHDYCNPANLISSVALFMVFKRIKIQSPRISKFISIVSSTTFGIYLIHEHVNVRANLYHDFFHLENFYNVWYAPLIMLAFALSVFIICAVLDILRQQLFKACRSIKKPPRTKEIVEIDKNFY